jgi:hypothetical protein
MLLGSVSGPQLPHTDERELVANGSWQQASMCLNTNVVDFARKSFHFIGMTFRIKIFDCVGSSLFRGSHPKD